VSTYAKRLARTIGIRAIAVDYLQIAAALDLLETAITRDLAELAAA
jgi:hypothetical protein